MKIVLLCVVALVMVVQLPQEGDAVCCYAKGLAWNLRCKDCSRGTPFCAKGKSCNIFGCNCKGGCRDGPCPSHDYHGHVKPVVEAPAGRDYESSYDRVPYGGDAAVPASDDYVFPTKDTSSGSEFEMSPSIDEVDTTYGGSSGGESDVSSSNDGVDTTYGGSSGGESEVSSSIDEVDTTYGGSSGGESEMSPSIDEVDTTYGGSSDGESEMSTEMKTPEFDFPSGSESEIPSSNEVDTGDDYGNYSDETEYEITSPDDVIKSADENRDGYMDIEEAERFLVKRGLASSGYRAKRSLMAIDLNNDNYISAEEIELYED